MRSASVAVILLSFTLTPAYADGTPLPQVKAQIAPAPIASSQPAPPAPVGADPPVVQPMRAQLEQRSARMRAQMEQYAWQVRASQIAMRRDVLGNLTPAQRSFVASTIGELATATQPNVAAAAARINSALTLAQRGAIVHIINAEASRRQSMFLRMVGQSQNELREQIQMPVTHASGPAPHPVPNARVPFLTQTSSAFAGPGFPFGAQPNQTAGALMLEVLLSPGVIFGEPRSILAPGPPMLAPIIPR